MILAKHLTKFHITIVSCCLNYISLTSIVRSGNDFTVILLLVTNVSQLTVNHLISYLLFQECLRAVYLALYCRFLIFINDIGNSIHTSILFLFADDTKLVKSKSYTSDISSLQDDLDSFISWSNQWNLPINLDKCHSIKHQLLTSIRGEVIMLE